MATQRFGWALALGAVLASQAVAQSATCPTGTNRETNPQQLMSGKTMCAARGSDRWQEYHNPSGVLTEYKRGPGHPIEPSENVGTWSASGGANALLTHTYSGGSSYSWAMCRIGPSSSPSSYTLVASGAGGTIPGVTLVSGNVGCP